MSETEDKVKGLAADLFTGLLKSSHIPLSAPYQMTNGDEIRASIDSFAAENDLSPGEIETLRAKLNSAMTGQWRNERYKEIFSMGRLFAQGLELGGKRIGVMHPKQKTDGTGKLTGLDAIRAVSSAVGVGKDSEVILPRSGIRVKLGIFREKEILALQVELAERRLDVGRTTRGALFGTDDVHLVVPIVDFILKHVVSCTVRLPKADFIPELRKLIKLPDVHALMVGALAAMYPNGYPFIRRCMNAECGYSTLVSEEGKEDQYEHMLFKYLYRFDQNKITPARFRVLNSVWDALTPEAVIEYQNAFEDSKDIVIKEVEDNSLTISATVGCPDYDYHRNYARAWLNSVINMVDEALDISDSVSEADNKIRRDKFINSTLNRLTLLRHATWVTSLSISTEDGTSVIDEPDDVYNSLEELCKEKDTVEKTWPAIENVKVESLCGFAGIPVYPCPECGEEQQTDKHEHPSIIPINITSYFFDITGYRILENFQ